MLFSEYGMVLVYIGGFGISDLFVKIFKLNNLHQLIYYLFLLLLGTIIYMIYIDKNNLSDDYISYKYE